MAAVELKKIPDVVPRLVQYIRSRVPDFVPEVGVICGSGLGHLAATVTEQRVIPYVDLQPFGFPVSTVQGHGAELVFGILGGRRVVLLKGRFHYYEGYPPWQVALPVRVLAALGVRLLVVTNAAGGVNRDFNIGDIMVIRDQIGLPGVAGQHPLIGPNDARFGPRFPAITCFDKNTFAFVEECRRKLSLQLTIRSGVYFGVSGPTYETPAEIGAISTLGGDSVGMSTIFEIIAAAHCGLQVIGLSVITNRCKHPPRADDEKLPVIPTPTHQEVLDAIKAIESDVQKLVVQIVATAEVASIPITTAYNTFKDLPANGEIPAAAATSNSSSCSSSSASSVSSSSGCKGSDRKCHKGNGRRFRFIGKVALLAAGIAIGSFIGSKLSHRSSSSCATKSSITK